MIDAVLSLSAACMLAAGSLPPCCAGANNENADAAAQISQDAAEPQPPAEALLAELEQAAGDLRAFTADIYYENFEDLLGRREIRSGDIIYNVDSGGSKSFAVMFDRLIIGDRAQSREKHYIFADRWLAEVDYEAKQFISREVAPPGREIDPLKLGEGPIPLPIGQPRHEVLARFDVELASVPDDGPLAGLDNVDGLRLTPKAGTTEAEDYDWVNLFYDRTSRLPVGIIAMETNGNRKVVRLRNVQFNPALSEEQLARLSTEPPDPHQWAIDIRPWRANRAE